MAIEVPSGNTTLLQSQIAQLLVQPLEQASTFLSAGPVIIDSASPIRVPRISAGATATSVGAGVQISDASVDFDEVTLLASDLKAIKVWLPLSNELIRQSVVALETVLQQRLITDVSAALDTLLWDGAGTSNTVKGILKQTGIATGTLDVTDADSLIDGMATALGNKVSPTHWVMTSGTFATLRKLKIAEPGTTSDQDFRQYLFDPSGVGNGFNFSVFGLPVIITDNIPNASTKRRVALVDFSKVVVARDVDADVKILDQTLADYDSVAIRVVTRYDVALLQSKAVTLLTEA